MPAASVTRPISPSSASTSRTKWPLPSPPIAGLQDIAPMVAKRWVTSAVTAPMRAAAAAASHPAWPPPTTSTSNLATIGNTPPQVRQFERTRQGENARPLFHVKQRGGVMHPIGSFADAKISEDDVQNVLDPNASGQALQCPDRQPDM